MNSSTLAIFSYIGIDVRLLMIDGAPWWVAVDVAAALGIANGRDMVARLDDDQKGVGETDTLGGKQQLTIINESGLYTAIIRSNRPQAAEFRRWVTGVVLPEIRQKGTFNAPAPAELSRLEILKLAIDSEQRALAAESTVAELAPRAEAWDVLASASGDYDVADAAKILARAGVQTGQNRLFAQLHGLGWIYRGGAGKWRARQSAVDSGCLAERPQSHLHPKTKEVVLDAPQVRVTARGLERLRVRLGVLELAS